MAILSNQRRSFWIGLISVVALVVVTSCQAQEFVITPTELPPVTTNIVSPQAPTSTPETADMLTETPSITPTLLPEPTPTIAPVIEPTATPPAATPTINPELATEGCGYLQGVNKLTASTPQQHQIGVVSTGRCDFLVLTDSETDITNTLLADVGVEVTFKFEKTGPQVYALNLYAWPQGKPINNRFAEVTPTDNFVSLPATIEVETFTYVMGVEAGDYRLVVNAAWPTGEVAFFNFHIFLN